MERVLKLGRETRLLFDVDDIGDSHGGGVC